MLKQLKIANYALIDKLDITFAPGLTIITGETGAGKSIMMGALSLILGEKAESRAIRALDKKSVIEVVFNINEYGLQHFFADNDIEYYDDGDCILRREISPNGRSRAFINDTPVTLPVMRALSVQLIDIHSQHSNMLLSSHRYQLDILDNLHSDKALPITYHNEYEKYKRIETRIHELRETNERRKAEEDYLQFQLSQIAELKLQPGEDIELEASERRLSNVNEIKNLLWQCEQLLEGDDDGMNSILSGLAQVSANLSNLNRICDETGDMSDRLETVIIDIKDMSRSISAMQNDIVDDPGVRQTAGAVVVIIDRVVCDGDNSRFAQSGDRLAENIASVQIGMNMPGLRRIIAVAVVIACVDHRGFHAGKPDHPDIFLRRKFPHVRIFQIRDVIVDQQTAVTGLSLVHKFLS